jgi:GTPase SAR1 family protein
MHSLCLLSSVGLPLSRRLQELREHASSDMVVMLVGNKTDLTDEREVSVQQGQALGAWLCMPVAGIRTQTHNMPMQKLDMCLGPPLRMLAACPVDEPSGDPSTSCLLCLPSRLLRAAEQEGLMFIETSAADGSNVEAAFTRVAEQVCAATHCLQSRFSLLCGGRLNPTAC